MECAKTVKPMLRNRTSKMKTFITVLKYHGTRNITVLKYHGSSNITGGCLCLVVCFLWYQKNLIGTFVNIRFVLRGLIFTISYPQIVFLEFVEVLISCAQIYHSHTNIHQLNASKLSNSEHSLHGVIRSSANDFDQVGYLPLFIGIQSCNYCEDVISFNHAM